MNARFEEAKKKSLAAREAEKHFQIDLPTGWEIKFPAIGFCRLCKKGISSLSAVVKGRHYYHKSCVGRSPAFNRDGGKVL